MKPSTIAFLRQINSSFYAQQAIHFDATRQSPWPGWQTLLDRYCRSIVGPTLEVLDVGCGNARFAHFLSSWNAAANTPVIVDYLGIDASQPLLDAAQRHTSEMPGRLRFRQVDLLDSPARLEACLDGAGPFDLVAVFGLLHHIPSEQCRRALLSRLEERTRPTGSLMLSFWQFENDPRFSQRQLLWDRDMGATAELVRDLEAGDHLLRWGPAASTLPSASDEGPPPCRYCHHTDETELERLLEPFAKRQAWLYRPQAGSDRYNLYVLLGAMQSC